MLASVWGVLNCHDDVPEVFRREILDKKVSGRRGGEKSAKGSASGEGGTPLNHLTWYFIHTKLMLTLPDQRPLSPAPVRLVDQSCSIPATPRPNEVTFTLEGRRLEQELRELK